MRLTFFSNYLNEHQLPLCLAFCNMPDVELTFIARETWPGNVGRRNMNKDYGFVLPIYESEGGRAEAMRHVQEDEVVIFGHMAKDEEFVRARMDRGLLTFRSAERLLKRGLAWRFVPPKAWRTYQRFTRYRSEPFYTLCASSYLAFDLSLAGFPLEKCLTWGYFPALPSEGAAGSDPAGSGRASAEDPIRLLWAGRLLDWKQPGSAIAAVHHLQQQGIPFHLQMAGDGEERPRVEEMVARYGLGDRVELLGALPREELAALMQTSDVFLFTSNRKEGWGAALGEAMACGCAVVANADAGSSPYLVEHGRNGLLYDGTQHALDEGLARLCGDPALREQLGSAARQTMRGTWNAEQAASNFIQLVHAFQQGHPNPIGSGPASPAPLFKDGWFKELGQKGAGCHE